MLGERSYNGGSILFIYEIEGFSNKSSDILLTEKYTSSSKKIEYRAKIQKVDHFYSINGLPSFFMYMGRVYRIRNYSFIQVDRNIDKEEWFGINITLIIRDPYNIDVINQLKEEIKERKRKCQLVIEYSRTPIYSDECYSKVLKNKNRYNYIQNYIITEPISVEVYDEGTEFYIYKTDFRDGMYMRLNLDKFMECFDKGYC